MSKSFLDAVKARRTFYGLSKEIVVPADKIKEIVGEAVNHTPSAFNSQSSRVVVLFGEQSDKLWSITKESLRKIVPAENFAATEERINGFANGYGTILFFEDQSVVKGLQEKFVSYADNFPHLVEPVLRHAAACHLDGACRGRSRRFLAALQPADRRRSRANVAAFGRVEADRANAVRQTDFRTGRQRIHAAIGSREVLLIVRGRTRSSLLRNAR